MKRIFTLSISFLFAFILNAQTQPLNASFENWENAEVGEKPVSCEVANKDFGWGVTIETVTKGTSNNQEGNAHPVLTTTSLNGTSIPGILTLGTLGFDLATESVSITGGMAYTERPTELKGYYKYNPAGTDTAIAAIWLLKGTTPDTIGGGAVYFTTPVSEWTEFTVNIEYISTDTPDTLNIVFTSSLTEGVENSSFEVDNISLTTTTTGITSVLDKNSINISPNPATSYFNVNYTSAQASEVKIHNTVGQVVMHKNFEAGQVNEQFDISNFNQGVYFVEINANGKTEIRKLIVK